MSKITLSSVADLTQSTTAQTTINANSSTVQTAFDNTLSRDGTSPNQMGATLDMNSNQIINLPPPGTINSPVRLVDVTLPVAIPNNILSGNNVYTGTNSFNGAVTFNVSPSFTVGIPWADYTTRTAAQGDTISTSKQFLRTAGYTSVTDNGGGVYIKLGSMPSPVQPWHFQSADGAWWQLLTQIVIPQQFGAKGDNTTDDSTAFQNAVNYAQTFTSVSMYIPKAVYVLATKINQTFPFVVTSDMSASLRWTTAGSAGWLADFRSAGSNFGLTRISLPILFSPAINSALSYPGYPSSWTGAARTDSAFTLWGGSRITIDVQTAVGWNNGLNIASTFDVTNGARSPQNIDIRVNTIDLCVNGIYLDGGPSGATIGLGPVTVVANTVFSKFPISLNSAINSIQEVSVTITGQAFTNEAGGAGIYDTGTFTNTSKFEINWLYAGHGSDSPTGTSSTLTLPFLAGATASHGVTTDGNATVGYFGSSNNDIIVGAAVNLAAFPGGQLPTSGAATRIRDVGSENRINVRYLQQLSTSTIALSTTQGEANFGGGVGAASINKRILVSCAVPTLGGGSQSAFWFYHTWLSAGQIKAITIQDANGSLTQAMSAGLAAFATDNSNANNREGIVIFKNVTGSSITGATYLFWIEIMN